MILICRKIESGKMQKNVKLMDLSSASSFVIPLSHFIFLSHKSASTKTRTSLRKLLGNGRKGIPRHQNCFAYVSCQAPQTMLTIIPCVHCGGQFQEAVPPLCNQSGNVQSVSAFDVGDITQFARTTCENNTSRRLILHVCTSPTHVSIR